MAETDSPLKLLVSTCILDFAAWLLQEEVQDAQPLNVELPGENLAVDLVFRAPCVMAATSCCTLNSKVHAVASPCPGAC